jgi:cytochrome P450
MFNRPQLPPGPSLFSQIGKRPKPQLESLLDISHRYGDFVKLPSFLNSFLINHVETIGEILLHRPLEFNKKNWGYRRLGKFLGGGLLTSDDEDWKKRRRLLQPIFHRQALIQSVPVVVEKTHTMIEKWESTYIAKNKKFNLAQEMLNLVLTISGMMLFSEDLTPITSNITKWINKSHRAVTKAIVLNRFLPTFNNIQFYNGLHNTERFAKFLIHKRRQNPEGYEDLLTPLLQAKDAQTGESLSEQTIIDEIKTFLITGHETEAYSLAWVWWHLMQHPDALEKATLEVDTVLGNRTATFDDINQLTYLRRVIEETMRIYPPIWVFARKNANQFEVQNYTIPANSNLIICPYTLHRHPLYWPNPEKFDPDRFLPENAATRPKLAYLPFGAGPRVCIAGTFAMLKIPLILATMLQKVVIQNKTRGLLIPKPEFSLKQNKSFWVKAKNRF